MEKIAFAPFDRCGVAAMTRIGDALFTGHIARTHNEGVLRLDAEEQMEGALLELDAYLRRVGLDLTATAKVTVILRDIGDFKAMHRAWMRYFPADPPARTTITSDFVDAHCRVQIEAVIAAPRTA